MEAIMDLKGVTKIYLMGKEKIPALKNVDLQINQGEICCLLGPSGSGKSTLLNMMAGLEKPTRGTIRFKKYQIEKMNENSLAKFRSKYIGFVFQSYNLIPTLSALENITFPLLFKGIPKSKRNKEGQKILKAMGLSDRWKHKPTEMSGGQQQRVSIARAFINNPKIIFADEPTGNLDTHTAETMMHLMIRLCRKNNQTLVIVTHNIELAAYADKIVHIRDGSIERIEMNENKIIVEDEVVEIVPKKKPVKKEAKKKGLFNRKKASSEVKLSPIATEPVTTNVETAPEKNEVLEQAQDQTQDQVQEKAIEIPREEAATQENE